MRERGRARAAAKAEVATAPSWATRSGPMRCRPVRGRRKKGARAMRELGCRAGQSQESGKDGKGREAGRQRWAEARRKRESRGEKGEEAVGPNPGVGLKEDEVFFSKFNSFLFLNSISFLNSKPFQL